MVGDAVVARLQAVGAADPLADVHRLAFANAGIDVEHPRLVVQGRIGDLDEVVAGVARIGRTDLADEAGDRRVDGLAGRGVEVHALVMAAARIAIRAKASAAEAVTAPEVLAGGIGEVVLAVAVDVGAAPFQGLDTLGLGLHLRRRQAQRGIGALDAVLQRWGADGVRFGRRLRGQADEASEHRDRQGASAPHSAMAGRHGLQLDRHSTPHTSTRGLLGASAAPTTGLAPAFRQSPGCWKLVGRPWIWPRPDPTGRRMWRLWAMPTPALGPLPEHRRGINPPITNIVSSCDRITRPAEGHRGDKTLTGQG